MLQSRPRFAAKVRLLFFGHLYRGVMGRPFQIHFLETLQCLDGAGDRPAEGVFVLVVSQLEHMAALFLDFGVS